MKKSLFEFPSYQYEVSDWDFKKKSIQAKLNKQEFRRSELQAYDTDRQTNKKSYVNWLSNLLVGELSKFCEEAEVSCTMSDAWAVRYHKGDYQSVHNHRSWGFSGILYLEYDPLVHESTTFVAPWQDPRSDTTTLMTPSVSEGTIIICPSFTHHFVNPQKARKQRTIISFDLLPSTPTHQRV